MDIQEFLQIGMVGGVLSGAIEFIKARYNLAGNKVQVLTVLISLVVALAYFALRDTNYWATILGLLTSATFVYEYLIKKVAK